MKRREGRFIVDEDGVILDVIKQDRFVKLMVEVWRHVSKKQFFTTAEEKTLHRLSLFLQMHTNAIVTPNGEYMTIERMADETEINRVHIRRVIKELMKKNALGRWSSNGRDVYYINPFLYQNGDVPKHLFYLFDEEYLERCKIENLERFKAGKKPTSLIAVK